MGVAGVDSVVGQWESSDLSLLLDYGSSSDSLGYTSKDEYKVTFLTISDRKAVVERFMDADADASRPYVAAIYFEDAGEGNRLWAGGNGRRPEPADGHLQDAEVARRIGDSGASKTA